MNELMRALRLDTLPSNGHDAARRTAHRTVCAWRQGMHARVAQLFIVGRFVLAVDKTISCGYPRAGLPQGSR